MVKDYNTQRKKIILPEYGRNIHKMVDHIRTIEDKEERNNLARQLINTMGTLFPYLRDIPDFKHKLWDHLAIMSDFKLDIDSIYELPTPESFHEKPNNVPYSITMPKIKHYGKNIEKFINKAIELEEGEEKNNLILSIANQMKKSYLIWNKDAVQDFIILEDLKLISKGKLDPPKNLKLMDSKDVLTRNSHKSSSTKKILKRPSR